MVLVAPSSNKGNAANSRRPKSDPTLNPFIYLLASMAVIGGFLFGYDTGIVSAAMLYVVRNKDMRPIDHLWQESIIAITPAFAAIGALFAGKLSDLFGRRLLIISSSVVFTAGALVCGAAPSKVVLLIGRLLLGLAIGVASMVVPVYISECSPTHVRGKMLTYFNIMVCFGQMAANIVGGGFSYIDEDNIGWRLMLGFAAVPSLIQLIGFMFLPESPRWLYAHRSEEESQVVLTKIYSNDSDWVDFELEEISATHEQELSSANKHPGQWTLAKIWSTKHVLKALLIGCTLPFFQQLAGINTIMYYTGALIKSAGIRDNHTIIWLSVVTSGVNFLGNFIPFLVIEKFGRRKVLLTSVALVTVSLVLLGTSFLVINYDTDKTTTPAEMQTLTGIFAPFDTSVAGFDHCVTKSNCDYCVTDDSCGFCAPTKNITKGLCLPLDPMNADTLSSTGYCSSTTNGDDYIHPYGNTTFEWADVYCKTKYTIAPLILMVVYLLVFSAGYAPLPWVLNAEFYPLWARGTCVSISTFVNWITNLLVSVTFLTLSASITRFGTFYLYAAFTAIAFVIFYKFVPETSNCSLDEVETLFMSNSQYEKYDADMKEQLRNHHHDRKQKMSEASANSKSLKTA